MTMLHAEYSEVIYARPEAIYAILSDYQQGHPAILPRQYFTELAVEQGGQVKARGRSSGARSTLGGRRIAFTRSSASRNRDTSSWKLISTAHR